METFLHDNLNAVLAAMAAVLLLVTALCLGLWVQLRRLRRGQMTVMGDGEPRDLVRHSQAMQGRVDELTTYIDGLEERIDFAGRRLDDCLTFRSVIRYDAYRDLSGMQSTSVALLDTRYSGLVISSIQGRDHARIYVKEIFNGTSKEKLAPEEVHVLNEAMGQKAGESVVQRPGGGEDE